MTRIPGRSRLRDAAYRAIWSILPDKLEAVLDLLDRRAAGVTPSRSELRQMGFDVRAARPFMVGEEQPGRQVAVLRLQGTIAHHAGWEMSASGGTSTDGFRAAFKSALNNSNVGAIVIDCDSPGGAVEGVAEAFETIFAARGQKDVLAVANAHMHSAAYWICAAADEIVVTPSGMVGDIGVMTVHSSYAEMDRKLGIERTLIKAGAGKGTGFNGAPLSEEDRASIQANVDAIYDLFVDAVARGRGDSVAAVKNGYGEGRSVDAQTAVTLGLADRVATLEDVLAEVSAKVAGPRTGVRAEMQDDEQPMYSDDGAICPDCGSQMIQDGDEWVCPECGTRMNAEVDEVASMAANAFARVQASSNLAGTSVITAAAAPGAGTSVRFTRPIPVNHIKKESAIMPPANEQPSGAAAFDRDAALKAMREEENERCTQIRALADLAGISAKADELIASGASLEDARKAILEAAREKQPKTPQVQNVHNREEGEPWETLGHFASAVMAASLPSGERRVDPRLMASAQGINQAIPSEGGFVVPPSFSRNIWTGLEQDPEDLVSMTDQYTIDGESLTLPANGETSRANGSRFGGVQGYWLNEADQVTKSKPKVRGMRIEPQELGVLVYATDKSLRNSAFALGQYLDRAARSEISFKSGDALYRGTGAGQPLGLMNSGSTITVNKESSQANGTILQENVSKMWSRLHPRARATSVWMINSDCEPALDTLSTVVKNVAGTENVGGYANKVFDSERRTLKGRPILVSEFCESLGTKGDIALVNWGWYATGLRSAGVRADASIHLRFDFNETAFRFMYELDGQPWLADPLTPFKGSNTQSWAIVLQAR
jgi:HK97 family phage major capsid protein